MSFLGFAALLLVSTAVFVGAQSSCKGRCGTVYSRANSCQCDYGCLVYGECCKDYERLCTSEGTCKGRCGEKFKRGRLCNCDSDCVTYNQCCPDHLDHCNQTITTPAASEEPATTALATQPATTPAASEEPATTPAASEEPATTPAASEEPATTPAASEEPATTPAASEEPATTLPTTQPASTAPPIPDLDGFEVLPESQTTAATDPTTAPPPTVTELPPDPTTPAPAPSSPASEAPPTTTPVPQTTTPVPQTTTPVPETSTPPPQTTTPVPEATTPVPETTTPVPEASTPVHEASTPVPEASTPVPEASTPVPEASTPVPEASTPVPEASTPVPEASTPVPEASTPVPEATTSSKETTAESVVTKEEATTAPAADVTTVASASKPAEKPFEPAVDPDNKPVLNGLEDPADYPADDSNDRDLCSGRPITGVTTLSNGTVVVFRGHYFWVLDENKIPGQAQGISEVWGTPSPIDTVFTRCNCQGKTYIFKGPQYWRYENDVMDPGYPKVVETGFDGLRGPVTAALSVPQHKQRREAVYFFQKGGKVQKYSYQFAPSSCGRKVQYAVYTRRQRTVRQVPVHVSLLEPAINYKTSWRGFPAAVTAAVSIPNRREADGFSYHIFNRAKSYRIRIEAERPVVAAVSANTSQNNEVFRCPRRNQRPQ